ncbi:MAG: ankyrin repeat domain-containing protein [Candidatus Eremiobacteraeota bacterium]|nr:ankyrin repeat domain-containing protein [Candidatus Eremiobacteraeota bacterium]
MDRFCPVCGKKQKSSAKYCNECGANMSPSATRKVELLDDRYQVESMLKSGNMGCIYRAVDTRLGETVAVKKMQATYNLDADGKKFQEMFLREAKLLAKLHHGGLPKVTDYFTKKDSGGKTSHYLVMTFIEGMDLECYLRQNIPPLPLDEVMGYFRQILDIFSYLHSQNPPVIYRDLKPSNTMIKDSKLYLIDFGIAKILKPLQKGTMLGTQGYASPDQYRGNDSPLNDIFSLGVLIHYLLTGLNPEDPSRPLFTFESVRNLNNNVPEFLDDLIMSMVDISSVNRPGSIDMIIEILDGGGGRYPGTVSTPAPTHISKPPGAVASGYPTSGVRYPAPTPTPTPTLTHTSVPAPAHAHVPAPQSPSHFPKKPFGRYNDFFKAVKYGNMAKVKEHINQGADVNAKDDYGVPPLHIAAGSCYSDAFRIVSLLVFKGADVNAKDNKGWTSLHNAAIEGKIFTTRFLIGNGANVNAKDNYGQTPLHKAAFYGKTDTAKLLISKGANMNTKNNNDETPLYCAAIEGNTDITKLLISKGANVNEKDNSGWTSLHQAARNGETDTAKLLISKGANINEKDNDGGTPLHRAAIEGKTDTARFLISKGADIDSKDNSGKTPLQFAKSGGYADIVNLLGGTNLDKKVSSKRSPWGLLALSFIILITVIFASFLFLKRANIKVKDSHGRTPLHHAAIEGKTETAKLLIFMGADINAKDNYELTPLHTAAIEGKTDTARFLISKGADIDSKDNSGKTPLQFAKSGGYADIVNLLGGTNLDKKVSSKRSPWGLLALSFIILITVIFASFLFLKRANIKVKDSHGRTPLHHAAIEGKTETAKLLIFMGADINAKDNYELTPLHTAAIEGKTDTAKLLISNGADINAKSNRGWTPMHWAAIEGKTETAKLLISKGADVNAKDKYGMTPLKYSAKYGNTNIVNLLRKHGAR